MGCKKNANLRVNVYKVALNFWLKTKACTPRSSSAFILHYFPWQCNHVKDLLKIPI